MDLAQPLAINAQPINRLAVAALVLSLSWLLWAGSVAGIVVGLIALRRIGQSDVPQRGEGLAIAAVAVGFTALLLPLGFVLAVASA